MSPTLAARRARVARIRNVVAAGAVAVFLVLFATIYIQMVAGKDPALGTTTSTAQVSTASSSSDDAMSPDDSTTTSEPVTTAQS